MIVDNVFVALLQLLQERQPIHPGHIDIGDHEIDAVMVRLKHSQGFDSVASVNETSSCSVADLMPEHLLDEHFQIRLVVDNQNSGGHAERSTLLSISLREHSRNREALSEALPRHFSSASRLVSAIAVGGYHDDRNVRAARPSPWTGGSVRSSPAC